MILRKTLLAAAALAAVALPALAHHSFAMFDNRNQTTWRGNVVSMRWANPHVFITIDVPAGSPQAGRWNIEGGSPNIMSRQGWRRNSFAPGDPITIVGYPLRDGTRGGSLYYALDREGTRLYHDVNRSGGPAGGG